MAYDQSKNIQPWALRVFFGNPPPPKQCGCKYRGLTEGLYIGPSKEESSLFDVCRTDIIQKGIGRHVGARHTSCILRDGASGACLPWRGRRTGGRPVFYMKVDEPWKRKFLIERGLGRQARRRWAKLSAVPLLWSAFNPKPLPKKITSACRCANPFHSKKGTGRGGRKPSLTGAQLHEIKTKSSSHSLSQLATMYGVSARTISRAIKKMK
jgi:hypothetical protein